MKTWTDADINFLKINYPIYGGKYCAEKLNRTPQAIYAKASCKGKQYIGRSANFKDISGQTFHYWTVINFSHVENTKAMWLCRCKCGKELPVLANSLTRGKSKSCGCYQKERMKEIHYTGGKYMSGQEFHQLKQHAEERNLQVNITVFDIEKIFDAQKHKCYLTGVPLFFNQSSYSDDKKYKILRGNASVDRIDSNLGYTLDNIQILHKNVNMAKRAMSQFDFILLCNNVSRLHPV